MSTSDLAAKRAALSDTKRALLQARLRGRGDAALPPRDAVTRCAGPGPVHPLSFAQERMWFMSQFDPELPIYNVPLAVLVSADLDVDALERAFSEVIRRHEALRTVFRLVDGEPRQVVLDPFRLPIPIHDVRDRVGEDTFRDDVQRLVEEEGARPMDIVNGPVIRVTLLRVSADRFALVTTTHHIATDGWSYPIILGEMEAFYEDFVSGRTHSHPDPALRYADYAVWEREHLQGETLERHVRFWREHLGGALDTELPGDRPRPPHQTFAGAFHHFRVPTPILDAARTLGREESATLNMVLLAAFDLLLARYTGTEDVTVGTLLGNRLRPELEQVVGFFVNTAAVRLRMDGEPTFRELVRRAKRTILDASEHQELPFDKVVEALQVPRSTSRQPLFQIMYFHHVYSTAYTHRSGGTASRLDPLPIYENRISLIDTGAAPFDLMLASLETVDGLDCIMEYARDLYDPATMELFARRFERMVERAAAQPDIPVSRLRIIEDEEEAQVLGTWSAAPAPVRKWTTVVGMLERRAADTPGAPALSAGKDTLSYREMVDRARAVASRLRMHGVGPEIRVAVCLERGMDLPVGMLGVLLAGGVYLPVDPELPAERIRYLLEDGGATLVLTHGRLEERFSGRLPVVRIDALLSSDGNARSDDAGAIPRTDEDGGSGMDPLHAAYVIYTSGSTGRPKGVVVPHGALANLAASLAERYALTAEDRVLQFASASFDVSLEELFPTWAAGGEVVLRTEDTPAGGRELAAWAEERGVTVLNLPTPFWQEWVREMDERGGEPPRTQRLMIVGSDRARPESFAAWERVGRGIPLLNAYGPTEAAVTATVHAHAPGADPREEIPVGRPVPGARALVLDSRGQPVPPGIPGELFLGGAGVARGYLDRPGLTAERFVPDPFSGASGARLYRTGDQARWRTDGTLEFRGRTDEQVKVRGFRIEPGEVEAALRAHPGVRQAAVAAREDTRGQRRLVAYVTGPEAPDAAELRRHLRERLPEHMVPAAYVTLDVLPMTASGKPDRRALPDPASAADEPQAPQDLPRDHVEETLARLWAEALGRAHVGVHDNFFELGGDSILSILVISRAAEQGIRITPRQIFLHPTIAELAMVAGSARPSQAEQGPVVGPAPLTPAQAWFFEGEPEDAHHWNHAVYLQLPVGTEAATAAGAIDALLAHHDALRLRFHREADGWRQTFAEPGGPVPLDVVDLAGVEDGALEAAILPHAEAAQAGLDLSDGPLLRAILFQLGPVRPPRLLLVIHHLAVDAVSWSILMEDLESAFTAAAAGKVPRLPAKTTSFRDWAERLAEHARSPEVLAEAERWRSALPAAVSPLLMDDPHAADTEGHAALAVLDLDEADTAALVQQAAVVYGARVDELLLAGLLMAVRRWSGASSVSVELEGHGREDLFEGIDLSRTVGWFTATFPLHLTAPASAGPGEVLKAVKEQVRSVPARGIGWGLLRHLGPETVQTELAALPWPEITFNYLGQRAARTAEAQGTLSAASEAPGQPRSPRQRRRERISIDGMVADGRLAMGIRYGGLVFRPETIQRLVDAWVDALRELAAHSGTEGAAAFTPSDFPEAGLDQDALDALMAQLGGL